MTRHIFRFSCFLVCAESVHQAYQTLEDAIVDPPDMPGGCHSLGQHLMEQYGVEHPVAPSEWLGIVAPDEVLTLEGWEIPFEVAETVGVAGGYGDEWDVSVRATARAWARVLPPRWTIKRDL